MHNVRRLSRAMRVAAGALRSASQEVGGGSCRHHRHARHCCEHDGCGHDGSCHDSDCGCEHEGSDDAECCEPCGDDDCDGCGATASQPAYPPFPPYPPMPPYPPFPPIVISTGCGCQGHARGYGPGAYSVVTPSAPGGGPAPGQPGGGGQQPTPQPGGSGPPSNSPPGGGTLLRPAPRPGLADLAFPDLSSVASVDALLDLGESIAKTVHESLPKE